MRRMFILVFLSCWLATAVAAQTQTLDQEMSALADKLIKALVAQEFKNVAAVDFTDLRGQPTELGRYLSERFAVEIVSAGGVSMVDRANLKSILAEHKLTEEGLVNPENAKKLGQFAGVDAILIGNITALEGIELMVKAISTDSAKIVAAGRITFPRTPDIQRLLDGGVSASSTGTPARRSVTDTARPTTPVLDRSGRIEGVIREVNSGGSRLVIETDEREMVAVRGTNSTPVRYRGEVYRISNLQVGDRILIEPDAAPSPGRELRARSIEVTRSVQDSNGSER